MQSANVRETSELVLLAPVDGVLVPLEDVPDPVFAGKMMGDGIGIDPTSSVLKAPCRGQIVQVHRAKHALTMRSEGGVSILLHIGLDTVKLEGKGFKALVKDGERVEPNQRLVEFDLDAIAQRAPSAVVLMVVTEGGQGLSLARTAGSVKAGAEIVRVGAEGDSRPRDASAESGEVIKTEQITIVNANGVHARPAAHLATLARQFQARVSLHRGKAHAPVTSVTEIMALDLTKGDSVWLSAQGPDATEALAALKALIVSGLGEDLSKAAATPEARQFVSSEPGVIGGVPAAPGLAIGVVKVKTLEVPAFETKSNRPAEEQQRLHRAIAAAQAELTAAKSA